MAMVSYTASNYPFWDDPAADQKSSDRYRRHYDRMTREVPDEIFRHLEQTNKAYEMLQRQMAQQQQMSIHPLFMSESYQQTARKSSVGTATVIAGGGGSAGANGHAGGGGGGMGYGPGAQPGIIPMGISQWKEHGKRHGYWDYFRDEILKEINSGQAIMAGTIVPIFGRNQYDEKEPVKDTEDKVVITPDITIGDKVSIKKHNPIIIK